MPVGRWGMVRSILLLVSSLMALAFQARSYGSVTRLSKLRASTMDTKSVVTLLLLVVVVVVVVDKFDSFRPPPPGPSPPPHICTSGTFAQLR